MKVVLVSSFPAFPTTAGNRSRIRQLALAIRQLGHDLTFVLLESKWESCDDAAHEGAFGRGKYIRIGKKHALAKWAWGVATGGVPRKLLTLAGIDAGHYSGLDRFRDRDFLAALARLDLQPDAVVVEYVLDSWAFEAFGASPRRVLDTHDAFGDRHKAYLARGIRDYWVSLRPASENAGLRRADVVLAIQDEEAQRFRGQLAREGRAGDPQVAVVGHLLDAGAREVDYRIDHSAVFLASDNAANRHSLQAFLEKVLPRVAREIPRFDLKLAGSICQAVGDVPNVTKLGWVDDAASVFARAPLSINPMLAGTGINIKLLEAMACGVATVSTVTGVRGLPPSLRNGVCVVADDDPQGFATAVVRLAGDEALRRQAGTAARDDALRWNAGHLAQLERCLAGG